MSNPLDRLKAKVTGGGRQSEIAPLFELMREASLAELIVGVTYDVYDPDGELVFKVKKRALNPQQIQVLIKEMEDAWARDSKKYGKMMPKGKRGKR